MPSERQHLLEPLGSATSTPISTTRESSLSESNLARKIAAAMREGARPTDDTFDQFMPGDLEIVSRTYWTPIEVATRVAEWLDELSIDTLMDIGSGAGKFCVAAAIVGKCRFIGLEQRPRLVIAARTLAQAFGVGDQIQFVVGDLDAIAAIPVSASWISAPASGSCARSERCRHTGPGWA